MEYMESKMQERYDAFEHKVESFEDFISDLLVIAKKHSIHNDDLSFVARLFEMGYMPPLNSPQRP